MQGRAPYVVWVQFQDELWMIDLVKGFWKIQQDLVSLFTLARRKVFDKGS